ncbi:MAG: glutamate 5-kinase [Helicobacteraceae bacterium]|nr:glutamate 5-kinase [Helicobacteraceae bacterium]
MRIVVKVGTSTLSENGALHVERMARLAAFLALACAEHEVLVVTSGAVAAGHTVMPQLSNKKTPERQALAAIGQALLMNIYSKLFEPYSIRVAQILITKDDFVNLSHSENVKIAVNTLLKHKILPIFNENDTVVIDELLRGDNDQLSAKVAHYLDADLLIILSDIDGYYDKNPKNNPDAAPLKVVRGRLDTALLSEVPTPNGDFATGGIVTKLKAADFLVSRGRKMFLASGFDLTHARDFLKTGASEKGTLFCP